MQPTDAYKPLRIEVREHSRGLNPSRWSWRITSSRGGRDWPGLPHGEADSGAEAMAAATEAARAFAGFSHPEKPEA